jgi:hypothetical protein
LNSRSYLQGCKAEVWFPLLGERAITAPLYNAVLTRSFRLFIGR